jgi:Dolichyl-phosphate-mannose-protein mannosyltransferase
VALTTESPPGTGRRALAPVLGLAAGVGAVHVVLSGRYGFHQDELYLLAAARHPALGYVDQPPLAPLAVRGITALVGEHLWALRLVSAAAHAGLVVAVAGIASALGGRSRTMVLAALAAATMPVFVAAGARFDPGSLGLLSWALSLWAVSAVLAGADPRWWLGAGAALGAALESTWTGPLLALGLVLGLALAPGARRHLRSRWPALGALVALVVWLPNLVWQALNGWPLLELHAAAVAPAGQDGLADFVIRQIVLAGPAGMVLGVAGVVWAWRRPPWRALAVPAVFVAAALAAVGGRAEDLAFAYVAALPAGVAAADYWAADDSRRWHQMVAGVAAGLILVPLAAPATSLDVYEDLYYSLDASLAEEVGGPETAALVARVYDILPAAEKEDARVVTAQAGLAATLDLYGPARGLPRGFVLSADRSYADWWPDHQPAGTVIFVDYTRQALEPYCDAMGPIAILGNDRNMRNEAFESTISVCSVMRVTPGGLRAGLTGQV